MPIGYRVPSSCPACGAAGTVRPETTLTGPVVRLTWCCRACRHEWPATDEDRERRGGQKDRRRVTRNDRRRQQD